MTKFSCLTYSGTVISTNSKEFPFVVFQSPLHIYLFPQSLFFLVDNNRINKAKNQKEKHFDLYNGEQLEFKIKENTVVAFRKSGSIFNIQSSYIGSTVCVSFY